jgi:hypothetical protein
MGIMVRPGIAEHHRFLRHCSRCVVSRRRFFDTLKIYHLVSSISKVPPFLKDFASSLDVASRSWFYELYRCAGLTNGKGDEGKQIA